ncbi:D-alanyl-D-alanine carboxypeptidase/D-alanyl-D-alanine-endopeptidase [Thiomicrorhabdus cannonii]|uniref:D-alanyl-D-alanine carboxypeptidase/D-alanyl-D-alanine-endopeptidase n=1 Tax=Thiomicrorhabdus cannonii TaxID=2748011 RepID=UPI0015B7E67C|nr:D-alanyl-D-alanine carboxypeptidase [Thiomicrorhabdus cannonii]
MTKRFVQFRRVCRQGLLVGALLGVVTTLPVAPAQAASEAAVWQALPELSQMQQAGLLVLDSHKTPLVSKAAGEAFVPASTTKLVTAFIALSHWGAEHRFKTDFFLQTHQDKRYLRVKGYGDPFLTSEELQRVAANLQTRFQQAGVGRLDGIVLDVSYFDSDLTLPGSGSSDNPYDAVPSALAANFNTLYLAKIGGKVVSAEPQTPLTPLAQALGRDLKPGKQRINNGTDAQVGQRYFAELLAAFLRQQGTVMGDEVRWAKVANDAQPFYRHWNAMTLAEVVKPMMKYSTNFIANQLALKLSAELYGAPASADKVRRLFAEQLAAHFDWQGAYIEEGAGLSRNNRLSPQQLVALLEAFRPWKALLPEVEQGVFAKSGSLIGVSALAGYIQQQQDWLPFVLMINEQVPYYLYRNEVAKVLARELRAEKPRGPVMQAAP